MSVIGEKAARLRLACADMPHMKHAAAIFVLTFYASFAVLSGTSGALALRLLFVTLAASALAAVMFMYRRPAIFAFPPASFALTLLLTRDITLSAAALLLPLSAGAVISYNLLLRSDKARTVALTSAAAALTAAALLIPYFLTGGTFRSYDELLTSLTGFLSSVGGGSGRGFFSEDQSLGVARYIILTMPALIIVTVSAVSFFASTLTVGLARLFSFSDRIAPDARSYVPSVVSAAVYLLAYFTSAVLIANTKADIIGYTAENLLIALLPAMMIFGERTLYRVSKRHEKMILFIVLSVLLVLISPSLYLMFVSFAGAGSRVYAEIRPSIKRFMRRFRSDNDDDDNDDDNDDNDDDPGGYGG